MLGKRDPGIGKVKQLGEAKNPGVEARAAKDRVQAAEEGREEERAGLILEKKAKLYDKLSRLT